MEKTRDSAAAQQDIVQAPETAGDLPYSQDRATEQQYPLLQQAFDFFNGKLFDGLLPPCLITLQRRRHTRGYHSPRAFVNVEGKVTDEIAMNPAYFAFRGLEETLSTLAHEMAHMWEWHFSKRPRAGYHSRAWADKMIQIGLVPSTTGAEGGAQTGDRVTHYIAEDGAFMRSAKELLATGYALRWYDRFPERVAEPMPAAPPAPEESRRGKIKPPPPPRHIVTIKPGDAIQALGVPLVPRQSPQRAHKTRYVCGHCHAHVWGKPGLSIMCRECNQDFGEG